MSRALEAKRFNSTPMITSPQPTDSEPGLSEDVQMSRLGWFAHACVILFSIVLPLAALGIEWSTHMCAGFFDPIPTLWHVGAILFLAATHASGLWILARRSDRVEHVATALRCNAVAIGISGYYSLWFAPLTPFAVVGIIFFGIGLLPLTPLISGVTALFLRTRLRKRLAETAVPPGFWLWCVLGFGGLLGLEIPEFAHGWALSAVASKDAVQQARGLWFLRHVPSEERLLRDCNGRQESVRTEVERWLFGAVSTEDRRRIYFRVTGRSFNEKPAPARFAFLGGRNESADTNEWVWDDAQGGVAVGRHLKGLNLSQSRIDATLDGNAATGYLEWTLVFKNDHAFQQREARALIQLPPGAVVSRLTLWIDGEEREAAFGGRSQTRQAYQAVVNQRRDPVLVSSKGADRVLVQCFPVPVHGGEMKVRIGITLPLVLENLDAARLALPTIIEKNFGGALGLTYAVWIESRQELSSGGAIYQSETTANGRHTLHGSLTAAQINSSDTGVRVTRIPSEKRAWTRDPRDPQNIVRQILARQPASVGPIEIVLDGSRDLGPAADDLADILVTLPDNVSIKLSVAADQILNCPTNVPRDVAVWLRQQTFVGGQDATMALTVAVNRLGSAGGTVFWIHGVQAASWQESTALEQVLARRKGRIALMTFSASRGPNIVLERIAEISPVAVVPRVASVKVDLARAIDALRNGGLGATREIVPAAEAGEAGLETSGHLARLWAADEVTRLLAGGQVNRDAAVALATKMQLVTAMTSAVVLENQRQYQAAGLEPADPKTVPSVPDTGSTLILLAAAFMVLIWLARHWRSSDGRARFPSGLVW